MGGPRNSFQWYLNGLVLASETFRSLILVNVHAADGGAYTCEVSNAAGVSNATSSVFITPYFTFHPQDIEGVIGAMVALTCEAESFPDPVVYQWSRVDGGELGSTTLGQFSFNLVFNPLQFGDEGYYVCSATSGEMTILSQPATVTSNGAF